MTAAVVGLGIASLAVIRGGISSTSDELTNVMDTMQVATAFANDGSGLAPGDSSAVSTSASDTGGTTSGTGATSGGVTNGYMEQDVSDQLVNSGGFSFGGFFSN